MLCDTCGRREAQKIGRLIDQFELPSSAEFEESRVLARMGSDKKRVAGRQRFVLPVDGGGVVIRDDVTAEAVREALTTVNTARMSG